MKVLVVGSGAREHAIAWKIGQSPKLTELHAAPGNAGIEQFATCHDVVPHDVDAVSKLAQDLGVDLVVVGSEGPLVAGLSNRLKKYEIPCVGPSAAAARIEGSKVFAKELMDRAQVPTARWEAFSDVQAALAAINRWRGPVVIKADGLTSGKGAFVCMTKVQAERALNALLVESQFGVAGRRVVVEEFLQGTEASIAVLTDGETILPLPVVRGDKRRDENNTGPNTDGMGAWLPVDELYDQQIEEAVEAGIRPALEDMRARGITYVGVLYADVLFTRTGPKVLEYNCRFGELEVQSLVRTLDCDWLELMHRTATGTLAGFDLADTGEAAVTLALVAEGYPKRDTEPQQVAIAGVNDAVEVEGVEIFVDGGAQLTGSGDNVGLVCVGGRVLTVSAAAPTVEEAARNAHAAASRILFEGKHVRADIAAEAGIFA